MSDYLRHFIDVINNYAKIIINRNYQLLSDFMMASIQFKTVF